MSYSKRREEISPWRTVSVAPMPKPSDAHEVLTPIVFNGTGAYLVAGPESRQVYCFTAQDPEQMIDARDVDALLRTGMFHVRS